MPVAESEPGSNRKLRPESAGGSLRASARVTYELIWRSLTAMGWREAGLPAFSRRSRRSTVSAIRSASSQLSPSGAFGRAGAAGAADWASQSASASDAKLIARS